MQYPDPQIHHISMLSTAFLRSNQHTKALSTLRELLGHVPASIQSGQIVTWPEYGLFSAFHGDAYVLPRGVPHWGGSGSQREDAGIKIKAELQALQFPQVCEGRPLMIHHMGDRASGWGMGSMVHELLLALASAHAYNRCVYVPAYDTCVDGA